MRVDQAVEHGTAVDSGSVVAVAPAPVAAAEPAPVEEELLVEDVSIDGMCGVY